jgi:hypothetical protein
MVRASWVVPGPALRRGVGGDGDPGRSFDVQPGHGGVRGGQVRGGSGRRWDLRPAVRLRGVQSVHGGRGGGEVEVEQAGQRGPALGRGILVVGTRGGIGADQVMEGVSVCAGLLEQVVAAQMIDPRLDRVQVGVGQGGRGVRVEVLPGVERGQAEESLLAGGEMLVRQGEGEFDAGVQAPVVVAFVEPVGVVGERPARGVADVPGDQAQGQG